MPIFKITHITKYAYDRNVKESVNEIMVYPYLGSHQEVLQHELLITGRPDVQTYTDYWGNKKGSFNLLPPHNELVIESQLVVRTVLPQTLTLNTDATLADVHEASAGDLQLLELAQASTIQAQQAIDEIVAAIYTDGKNLTQTISDCCTYVYKNFRYVKGITSVETTVDEIIALRSGVCQDFAHLMLQVLRTLRIPCRYVSGYICPNKNGMRGEGATHAWVEAWVPGSGWVGSDPTNNVWVSNRHVKLAVGRHFKDCSPVKGTFKGVARQKLSVYVSVSYEDGQTIEEMNNVPTGSTDAEGAELVPAHGVQAQQQ